MMQRTDSGHGACGKCGYEGRKVVREQGEWVRVRCGFCGAEEWVKALPKEAEDEEEDLQAAGGWERARPPACGVAGCVGHQVVYKTAGAVRYLRCSVTACTWRGKKAGGRG